MSLSLRRYTIKNFKSLFSSNHRSHSMPPSLASNTNSHSMASHLTRSSARMGALELELEPPEIPLDQPEDGLQEDSRENSCAPGKAQPAATKTENLALRTQAGQLETNLAVAHDRIRDLTEINSLLRRTAANPAPARDNENAKPPPPPERPPPPDSHQGSMPSPGNSRLSCPALVTCLGESLLAGVGLDKSYTDAPVFNSTDRELYMDWKRAVLPKLTMSACLYPTPDSGVLYMASRLAGVVANILNHAIDEGEPEADDGASAFHLLDNSYQDLDKYGTALAAMDRPIVKADDIVDTFLAKWKKLNIKLGRNKNSRPAVTKFRNKLPASLTSKLLDLRPTSTLAQLISKNTHACLRPTVVLVVSVASDSTSSIVWQGHTVLLLRVEITLHFASGCRYSLQTQIFLPLPVFLALNYRGIYNS